ncbi:MAG: UDP-N-acetylmuramoyl-tripeptide--D-alanyl-D-alanine ligase [Planctomycetota bacterium]|nr:UDP-N-acetylmuramoyl-tripeptide--D-alanyl-D-alanine ligase [Planctomycetota bacterium]
MTFWTPDAIKGVLGGTWLARADAPADAGVGIDTRTLQPGQLFVALRGERTDGHAYLRDAVRAGAAMLVIDDPRAVPAEGWERPVAVLHVPDAGAALLRLGAAYRKTLDPTRVIAVGGSNGKTTTVRLIHAALAPSMRGTHAPRSFNNAVGLPLTLLGARRGDQYLVCEIGTNAPGEIAPLASVAEPDIAVITSIGREHLEGLGSLRGVAQEEASLLLGLRAGGVAILNADAPHLVEAARPIALSQRAQVLTFGRSPEADLRVTDVRDTPEGLRVRVNEREALAAPLHGKHNALNMVAAFAVARRLGLDTQAIAGGLARATPPPMRLQRVRVGEIEFLNDAYNANPESLLAAVETFGELYRDAARRVLILGDMLEQGVHAPALHEECAAAVGACAWADLVVLVGPHWTHSASIVRAALGDDRVRTLADVAGPNASRVAQALRPGDAVLLKGSRGVALERVLDACRLEGEALTEFKPGATA